MGTRLPKTPQRQPRQKLLLLPPPLTPLLLRLLEERKRSLRTLPVSRSSRKSSGRQGKRKNAELLKKRPGWRKKLVAKLKQRSEERR